MADGQIAFLPYQVPIDAYGNGGFRFAEMSHKGSLLCLPTGTYGWEVENAGSADAQAFTRVLSELVPPGVLLFGTGPRQVFPALEVRRHFIDATIGLESMDTGAACRTYNVLLAEGRQVAAALIAVP